MKKSEINPLTVVVMALIAILAILGAVYSSRRAEFLPIVEDILLTLLPLAANILYLLGSGLILLGSILIAVRFIKTKLKDPCQPSGLVRHLSGYLVLGLELFIGAEILLTATKQTWEEFGVLFIIIVTRLLLSLVLYLEGRWHGKEETETVCNVS